MINEGLIGKEVEESNWNLSEGARHSPGTAEKNLEEYQANQCPGRGLNRAPLPRNELQQCYYLSNDAK
jgi:hypothetical protein